MSIRFVSYAYWIVFHFIHLNILFIHCTSDGHVISLQAPAVSRYAVLSISTHAFYESFSIVYTQGWSCCAMECALFHFTKHCYTVLVHASRNLIINMYWWWTEFVSLKIHILIETLWYCWYLELLSFYYYQSDDSVLLLN